MGQYRHSTTGSSWGSDPPTFRHHHGECGDSAGSGTTQPAYAVAQAIADGLLEFYNHHYKPSGAQEDSHNSDDSDIGESDPIVTAASSLPPPSTLLPPPPPPPPRPPPPPPPPAVVAASRHGDGISHMAMMAKSRMHEELVNKANAMTLNHTANNKHSTAMDKRRKRQCCITLPPSQPTTTRSTRPPPPSCLTTQTAPTRPWSWWIDTLCPTR